MPYGQGSGPPRRRSRLVIIVVIVVVLILVVSVLAYSYFAASSPPVQVGFIEIWAPDNVCGLNSNPIEFYGFNSSTSAVQTIDFGMPNYNTTQCVINGATTNTSGFTLSDVQAPVYVAGTPAGSSTQTTGSMNITITSPSSSYSGNMNLVLR